MSTRIETLNPETTTGKSKELFNAVQNKLGFIPNLIKVFGNSPATLQTYLSLGELTASGNFNNKFREQLALAIAEENACNYCLSAHTTIGKMNGLTVEETEQNRQGLAADAKTQAGLQFAQEVTKNRGQVSTETIQAVKEAGYNDGDILEIILNVVSNTLTNYVNHIAETEVDFPSVEAGKFAVTAN
ncbi:carboxymuconolactone decarboxylase family protein [Jejuia spongiicola]|uniref:Carboxymuconolactone decarboxylase family protein n=1 Tax=Jejuia spongiicola TaxID=2942207 RepID=A0ABT0Q9V0_9FLAO|nr:carboxymuconolactone decarboxylase family protein [Jejuia spongiicola]MCL6293760.1 carboxymuconolactone decarboxylase family protein [Jejuia spongiicola]